MLHCAACRGGCPGAFHLAKHRGPLRGTEQQVQLADTMGAKVRAQMEFAGAEAREKALQLEAPVGSGGLGAKMGKKNKPTIYRPIGLF